MSYVARDGKVYARERGGVLREVGTALTARGRDLEAFDAALSVARQQREQRAKEVSTK